MRVGQPPGQLPIWGDIGGLIGGVDHHAGPGAPRLFHIFYRGIVYRHFAALPALGEPGGQLGSLLDAGQVGLPPLGPQDDVGAVDLLGVEPQVALESLLGSEQVVLGVVFAHGDTQAGGGAELHGLRGHPLAPVSGFGGAAEISGVGELLADLLEVPLSLRQSDGLQHAVQVVQVPPAFL